MRENLIIKEVKKVLKYLRKPNGKPYTQQIDRIVKGALSANKKVFIQYSKNNGIWDLNLKNAKALKLKISEKLAHRIGLERKRTLNRLRAPSALRRPFAASISRRM